MEPLYAVAVSQVTLQLHNYFYLSQAPHTSIRYTVSNNVRLCVYICMAAGGFFGVCVRVGVEVCSEGDTVAGVHKYRGPM